MALSNPTRRAPLAALALTATLATGAQAETYNGYEVPPYRVEARAGAFELRQYEPHLVAEVVVEGSRSSTASRGFRALANYIFGGNDRGEKIAMTVPVTQTPVDGGYRVRFAMPSRFDRTALPDPESDAVRLLELGNSRQAVVQFSGWSTKRRLKAKEAELRAWMAGEGLTPAGAVHYYFYNDPFTAPWNRRTEVALMVAPAS